MFEIIKTIVELLKSGVDGLGASAELRDKKRRREVGAELALLYLELCRILAIARDIVSSLEVYVQRMGSHLAHGNDSYALTAGEWIRRQVVTQRVNVARFSQSAQRLEPMLNLLQPKAHTTLQTLLHGKRNALDSLYELLGRGLLPIDGPDRQTIREANQVSHRRDTFAVKGEISTQLARNALDTAVSWDAEVYNNVQDYLLRRSPKEAISELETMAESLRATIEKHFTLADILIDVRDSRHGDGREEFLW
jgi:hypothetical protein